MYKDVGIPVNNGSLPRSINAFVASTENIYDPKHVSEAKFKEYADHLNTIVEGTQNIGNKGADNPNLENMLKIKEVIKKMVVKYSGKDKDTPFDRIRFKSGLSSQGHIADKKKKAAKAVDLANENVVQIPIANAQSFYRSVFFKEKKDIIDNIIAFQTAVGCRLIECLNPAVATFSLVPGNLIKQVGFAKEKGTTNLRSVEKPAINMIDARDAMEFLDVVRKDTAQYKDLTNKEITSKYNGRVNDRMKKYFEEAGIPITKQTQGSHSNRKLYANYMYAVRTNRNQTKHNFIKKNLGHTTDGSTMNYNSIEIVTDPILEKDSAQIVASVQNQSNTNMKEIEQLKEELHDVVTSPPTSKARVETVNTGSSFAKIEQAIQEGHTTYKAIAEASGANNYMINKYKQAHKLTGRLKVTKPKKEVTKPKKQVTKPKKEVTQTSPIKKENKPKEDPKPQPGLRRSARKK